MSNLNANINRTAALPFTGLSALGAVAVAARLVASLTARGGIDSPLNEGRRSLGLDLRNRLRDVLGQGGRYYRGWEGCYLHLFSRLTHIRQTQFLHSRNEDSVNHPRVNMILKKSLQIISLIGVFTAEVQP